MDWINLRLDSDNIYIRLMSDDEEKLCIGFSIMISCSSEDAESRAEELDRNIIEIPVDKDSELKYLLRLVMDDDSNPNSYYYTNIRFHRICLTTNLPVEELLNALNGCQYTTIDEYAEKTA